MPALSLCCRDKESQIVLCRESWLIHKFDVDKCCYHNSIEDRGHEMEQDSD